MNTTITTTAFPKDDADPGWLIEEDGAECMPVSEGSNAAPWRVLIVDDDVDVHVVTKFSLSNACFMGRRLSYLHAYSAAEAFALLRDTPDIALVLLDVIMETKDAGLLLARRIREELGNNLVRIVLRTGQPGEALEHSIVLDYDINDFWCKTDLTTRKLFTTVISSLRSYASLVDAEQRIASLSTALHRAQQTEAALGQHVWTLNFDSEGHILDASEALCAGLAYTREELLLLDMNALFATDEPEPAAPQADAGLRTLAAIEPLPAVLTGLEPHFAPGKAYRLRALKNDGTSVALCANFILLDRAGRGAAATWLAILSPKS
jgi:CheY-like chemotaxis protein